MKTTNKKVMDNLSKVRLLVPLVVIVALAARNYYSDGIIPQYLKVIPQNQFVSSMGGFLTVRFSIFLGLLLLLLMLLLLLLLLCCLQLFLLIIFICYKVNNTLN